MNKENEKDNKEPAVAPGIDDNPRGESATKEDIRKHNYTKDINLIWDKYDPS